MFQFLSSFNTLHFCYQANKKLKKSQRTKKTFTVISICFVYDYNGDKHLRLFIFEIYNRLIFRSILKFYA